MPQPMICGVLEQFLKKEKIAKELWPTFDPLDGEGWIHLNDGGRRVISAYYSTNAIPHSTQVTAFIIAPAPYLSNARGTKEGEQVAVNPHYWSYATLGDMSFGEYNLPGYQGQKPPDTGFKEDFFAKFKAGLQNEYPDIPASNEEGVLTGLMLRNVNQHRCTAKGSARASSITKKTLSVWQGIGFPNLVFCRRL